MQTDLIEATPEVLEERRRTGTDKQDERWAGDWHLVNPPKYWHAWLNTQLLLALAPRAASRGLRAHGDGTGIFAAADDWRVPDQAYAPTEAVTADGLVTARLVVEIRAPGDETYEKLPFYAGCGVDEVLVVHEDRTVELFARDGDSYRRVPSGEAGTRSDVLDVDFLTVDGPALRITDATGLVAEV